MPSSDLSQKIIAKIKERKIMPKPRWEFLVKNYLVWVFGALSLILGAMTVSILIVIFRNNDWSIFRNTNDSWLKLLILSLPYFWLVFLIVFIFITQYNVKHTRHGYRWPLPLVAAILVASSSLLGLIFYGVGFGQAVDRVLVEKVPAYGRYLDPRMRVWSRVEDGLLTGLVITIVSDEEFELLDVKHDRWLVNSENARFQMAGQIQPDMRLKIIGEVEAPHIFDARIITPFFGPANRLFFMTNIPVPVHP